MSIRTRLGRIRRQIIGAEPVTPYESELRSLQDTVAALQASLAQIETSSNVNVAQMRTELRAVTDDLGDRIGALTERLDTLP